MIYAIIDERQKGKTTLALDLFLKDPENSILIVDNINQRIDVLKKIESKLKPEYVRNIKPYHKEIIKGLKFKVLIIDELFFKRDFKTFIDYAKIVFEDIYITSTYKEKIKNEAFLKLNSAKITNVKNFRENNFYKSNTLQNFEKFYNETNEH